jgi:hypothetical protein
VDLERRAKTCDARRGRNALRSPDRQETVDYRMRLELVVLAPRLLAQSDEALAACRPLASLARYARGVSTFRDVYAALFATLGLPQDTPIAPLALLGSGGDPADDFVLCAQPAHLEAGPGHALDIETVSDLPPEEIDIVNQVAARELAGDDLRFDAVRAGEWFARRSRESDVTMTSPDAARGRPLAQSVAQGADAAQWKRWQDEIGMLLHDHPVNQAREASGKALVNAVWLFGGGRLRNVRGAPPLSLATSTPASTYLGDLAQGLVRVGDSAAASSTFTVAIAGEGDETRALDDALARLERNNVAVVHLVAAGRSGALAWTASAPGLWRRIVARATPHRLALPPHAGPV